MPASPSLHSKSRQSRRSRSSTPYPLQAHSDTGVSQPPAPVSSDNFCVPGQDATSRAPAPDNRAYPQSPTDHLQVGAYRAPGYSNEQASQVSLPVTQINVVDSISAPKCTSPWDLVARPPVAVPHLPDPPHSAQSQHPSYFLPPPSQQSLGPERQSLSGKEVPPPRGANQGILNNARDFTMTEPTFIDGSISNITNNFHVSINFMEKLLKQTIPGAAADSSARDPPPRCHPGTRLAILDRCLCFIVHCEGVKKMRWVVGAAGVGKSAVMQSVAESPQLKVASNASVFFSINGRDDGNKAIVTLSYQFAAKSDLYRRVIEDQVSRDPSLLQSSMSIQFERFVVQPFIRNPDLNTAGRVLIIIDGLDECNNTRTQVDLLRLISNFCISYPSSPIVWLIASRPEPHITSFFARPEVLPAYEKEEIAVDSDEARSDVERFLRHELKEIGVASGFLGPQWPDEQNLWKLADAAGGLFAYAHTAIRYIGDSNMGDPVSQLSDVLNVIDELPLSDVPPEQHPMALLDALYARILSRVPTRIMINARKLLLLLASNWDSALSSGRHGRNFIVLCNWLYMTANEVYAALNHLRSVLSVPQRHEAHREVLKSFHKSFIDYISRSGLFTNVKLEAQQIKTQCAFRVLKEAPSGIDFGDKDESFDWGWLARNDGTRDNISIPWRADEGIDWDDNETRLIMYKLAIGEVVAGIERGVPEFQSEFCIKPLITQFREYSGSFPLRELCDCVFDKSRRGEFMKNGILKQIPAKAIDISNLSEDSTFKLQFHRPVATTTLPDPWNSSCEHEREGQWELGREQNWTTVCDQEEECTFCFERLKCQLESLVTRNPDHPILIMFASETESRVEVRFVDPGDDVSEWTYWFWIDHSLEERKELESSI